MLKIKLKLRNVIAIAVCLVSSATLFAQEKDGVTINRTTWAARYVGTPRNFVDNPSDYGRFYQWNSNRAWTKDEDKSEWDTLWLGNCKNTWQNEDELCPYGWRLPSVGEIKNLIASGSFTGTLNGVKGNFFVGDSGELLFFPYGTLDKKGRWPANSSDNYGNIWTNTGHTDTCAYNMGYNKGAASWSNSTERAYGLYVRCVKK